MSNTLKYILIAILVILVVGAIGIVVFGALIHGFSGVFPYMMGPRNRIPFGPMPMMGGLNLFGLVFFILRLFIPFVIIGLVILALVWLLARSRTPIAPVAPAPPVYTQAPAPAPRTCPNCGRAVQADWSVCPYCGQKLPEA